MRRASGSWSTRPGVSRSAARRPTPASPAARSSSTATAGWRRTAAAASRARTRQRSTDRPPTWLGTWPRTSWRPVPPTGSRSRWRTRSARPTRSRSRSTRSGPRRWIRPRWSTSCGRRSTSGRPRSSGTWTCSAPSTRTPPPTATSVARSSRGRRPIARMSSAARSADAQATVPNSPREAVLSGPVSVCVDRPRLSLDRSFTYELRAELGAGVGSLVQVPFHGRLVRAWVLGATDDVPERVLAVRASVSPVRFFDERRLALFRRMSERYVAPLATVIGRAVPPRVASEERVTGTAPTRSEGERAPRAGTLGSYRNGDALLDAIGRRDGAFVVRPGPDDEAAVAIACVDAALGGGRTAIVIVPDAEPVP